MDFTEIFDKGIITAVGTSNCRLRNVAGLLLEFKSFVVAKLFKDAVVQS